MAAPIANLLQNNQTATGQQAVGATVLLSVRGAFYKVALLAPPAAGIYAIKELQAASTGAPAPAFNGQNVTNTPLLSGNPAATGAANQQAVGAAKTSQAAVSQNAQSSAAQTSSPILIMGVDLGQSDVVSPVLCLDNYKVFYTFGQNFGKVTIAGMVLLGPMGAVSQAGFNRLVNFFWQNRVSVKQSPITVSVDQNAYLVYLTGMGIGSADPEFHTLPFQLYGTLLDINRNDASTINPSAQVLTGADVNNPSLLAALTAQNPTPIPSQASANPAPSQTAVGSAAAGVVNSDTDTTPPQGTAATGPAGAPAEAGQKIHNDLVYRPAGSSAENPPANQNYDPNLPYSISNGGTNTAGAQNNLGTGVQSAPSGTAAISNIGKGVP
jgi:hypothetical protein